MSQMPDKIWLHKDTKYNTGDVVCGYQYDFVQGIEDEGGIENFVEYVPFDVVVNKAVEYIVTHIPDMHILGSSCKMDECIIKDFKDYMEGE